MDIEIYSLIFWASSEMNSTDPKINSLNLKQIPRINSRKDSLFPKNPFKKLTQKQSKSGAI